jgi:hypothetical protein
MPNFADRRTARGGLVQTHPAAAVDVISVRNTCIGTTINTAIEVGRGNGRFLARSIRGSGHVLFFA